MKRTGRRKNRLTDAEVDIYCQDMEDILTKLKARSESKKKKKKKPRDILLYNEEDDELPH